MVITALNTITPLGHDTETTAASVRAGISRLRESEKFWDRESNPITEARIQGFENYEATARIESAAVACLETLLQKYGKAERAVNRPVHFLVGTATPSRPGPRYEGKEQEIAKGLSDIIVKQFGGVHSQLFPSGNASVIDALEQAGEIITGNSDACCIVCGLDSLLAFDTLYWFEKAERLKSETFGRSQGFSPGEAVGFIVVESKEAVQRAGRAILAEIVGIGCAQEPAPFVSDSPCKGHGLTAAVNSAIDLKTVNPNSIKTVLADLNGEFFRAKEWTYTEMRCFQDCQEPHQLWHPADCMGSLGAASGAVLINLAVSGLRRGWLAPSVLVSCSDDEGACGVAVIGIERK